MKYLWTYIDDKDWLAKSKYRFALLTLGCLFGLLGLALWMVARCFSFAGTAWMICFVGYPVVLSWYVVFIYACNHEFH